MSDLTPFTDDDSALDAEERRLLRAGRDMGVPRGAKRAVWVALAAGIPSVAAATTATASVLTTASLVKYGAIGVLLGATTMTTVTLVRTSGSAPAPTPPASAMAAPPRSPLAVEESGENAAPAGIALPPPSAAPAVAPGERRAVPSPAAVAPARSEVASSDTESRRVAAARALQRAGRTREALSALDGIARDLPNGELVQEREALAIEALLTLGDRAAARQRATAFTRRFPDSPHTATARRALE
jgi:hypothetical protein